ncbi:MAG: MarR family winged helix-turn-helix transcriptional regulator [Pseudomonadota bacterium]
MTVSASAGKGLDLSVFTPYRIAFLGRLMSEELGAAYSDEDLTIPEWRVLAVISQQETVAARDVVARTPMDKMAVSRAVSSLQTKKLILRERTKDRRVSALKLSPKGKSVFERVSAIALDYEQALLGAMPQTEREAFFAGLARLESAIESSREKKSRARAAE